MKVYEGILNFYKLEDGGHALLTDFDHGGEKGMFVRIQSWVEEGTNLTIDDHKEIKSFLGKKIRITIEEV